jgi:hypothetical protein
MVEARMKRLIDVSFVYAILWGVCFLMTVPVGVSDLKFSALFAIALSAALLVLGVIGRFFRLGVGQWWQRRASPRSNRAVQPVRPTRPASAHGPTENAAPVKLYHDR